MLRNNKRRFEIVVTIIGCLFVMSVAQASWLEQAKLTASDGAEGDNFGQSVSISGNYTIVGARRDDDNGNLSGSAYIFKRDCTSWIEQTKLVASDGNDYDYFGYCVSIDGNYALVGAPLNDANGFDNSGSAYIFKREGEFWIQQTKLTASDGESEDRFGISTSISGDYCVVGADGDDDNGDFSGSAYIFERSYAPNDPNWYQQAKLTAFDGAEGDYFGRPVSIGGDYAIVGADGDDDNGERSGSAYIFRRDPNTESWIQQVKIVASDAAVGELFGHSVSIGGDYAIVGANYDDDNGYQSGSAYIFERSYAPNDPNWYQQAKLTASDGAEGDNFGQSVSISGDQIIVGADYDDDNGTNSGSAYIFTPNDIDPNNWDQQAKLIASDGDTNNVFGCSVSISDNYAIIGAFRNSSYTGSAYVFGPKVIPPAVDLNNDCSIDLHDLAIMTENWVVSDPILALLSSCVGHWKMNDNDASTTVVDSSGNGNDGTAQQNTQDLNTPGKIDGALTFDGTSDYVDVGPVIGTGAYTKVAWIKRDAGSYSHNIISGDAGTHAFWAPSGASFKLSAGHNNSWYLVQDSNALDVDVWYHVVVTFDPNVDSGKMVLYKNGVQVDSATGVVTQSSSATTYIGRYNGGYYFKGSIDNVMIFDRALTPEEIEILYGTSGLVPSSVGHWKMNDNDANTTVVDSSVNGNHGIFNDANDPNTNAHSVPGKINGALTFDGIDDFVDVVDVVGTGAYTKVAWVRRDAGSYSHNVISGDAGTHAFWVPSGASFKLSAGHNGSWYLVQDSNALDVDVWYHVAVTFDPNVDSGRMVLYKNGVLVDSATGVATQSSSTTTYIGSYDGSFNFKGSIDNVMIFDRALTTEAIGILYNGGSGTEIINGGEVEGDINNDGIVNFSDFAEFANNWLEGIP